MGLEPIIKNRTLTCTLIFVCSAFILASCHSNAEGHAKLTRREARGKQTFDARCAMCHDAFSNTPRQGPGLKHVFAHKFLPSGMPANDERVRDTIKMGRANMPAFANQMDDDQINEIIAYLHRL